jgi:hypothetical protein
MTYEITREGADAAAARSDPARDRACHPDSFSSIPQQSKSVGSDVLKTMTIVGIADEQPEDRKTLRMNVTIQLTGNGDRPAEDDAEACENRCSNG